MNISGLKYNYDDVSIVPDVMTNIRHRKECSCYTSEGLSPIWASPMDTVISKDNWRVFSDAGINVVLPRNIDFEDRISLCYDFAEDEKNSKFVAFSLNETKKIFRTKNKISIYLSNVVGSDIQGDSQTQPEKMFRICIDVANGHMKEQIDLITAIKKKYGECVKIMGGNIANPNTYKLYDEAGCDYLRVGIAGGFGCLTGSNTGVFYPLFSLIKDTYFIKKKIGGKCKIIADGGIKGFRDVQKALIYADYVMIGSLFNKAIESAAKTTYGSFYWNIRGMKIYRPLKSLLYYGKEVPKEKYDSAIELIKQNKLSVWKEFYGMSTKKAQANIIEGNGGYVSHEKLKTSEGKVAYQKVEYSVKGWMRNEMDYLCSAMSYTNSRTLDEYKESGWVTENQIKYNK